MLENLNQLQFRKLSRELGLAGSSKALSSSAPLGADGLDINLELVLSDISEDSEYWMMSTETIPEYIPIPKVRIIKGFPLNIDAGAFYSDIPNCKSYVWGAELKWAIMEGRASLPDVAIRGGYTQVEDIEGLELDTRSADISFSRDVESLIPYAGFGKVWIESDPEGFMQLNKVSLTQMRYFIGIETSLLWFKTAIEAEFAHINSYSLKLSASF